MITDSWFIGAFGKWWRGGILEAWYQDIVARSKDEEGWNSGILTMKSLDKCTDYQNGKYAYKPRSMQNLTWCWLVRPPLHLKEHLVFSAPSYLPSETEKSRASFSQAQCFTG